MKSPLLFAFFFLFLFSSFCSARTALPFTKGVFIDDNLLVQGVNLYGPGFNAGIRPGDRFIATTRTLIDQDAAYPVREFIIRGNTSYIARLTPAQLTLPTQQGIFLLKKDSLTFDTVKASISSDPFLKKLLLIRDAQPEWGLFYTDATLLQSDVDYSSYILAENIPSRLRIRTVLFFTTAAYNTYTMFHIDLKCTGYNEAANTWYELPSSGILQRDIMKHLLKI
ncbi:MAG: hypothetical protein WCS30_09760 [Selenomonadaceae bacterium]